MDLSDETHSKIPSFNKFRGELVSSLQEFERARTWPDLIKVVQKLQKTLTKYKNVGVMPEKLLVCRRLAQSLNPTLPSGVHKKVLETYELIFTMIGSQISTDIPIYSTGLFPLLPSASMDVKPMILALYEKYYVPLPPQSLSRCLGGLLSSTMPLLEEENSDVYGRVKQLVGTIQQKMEAGGMAEVFYYHMWENVRFSEQSRLACLAYLISVLPKSSRRRKESLLKNEHLGNAPKLAVQGICASLMSCVEMAQRLALDLLNNSFMLHEAGPLDECDRVIITRNVLLLMAKEELPLTRRLSKWFEGDDQPCPEYYAEHSRGRIAAAYVQLINDPTFLKKPHLWTVIKLMDELGKHDNETQEEVTPPFCEYVARLLDQGPLETSIVSRICSAVRTMWMLDFIAKSLGSLSQYDVVAQLEDEGRWLKLPAYLHPPATEVSSARADEPPQEAHLSSLLVLLKFIKNNCEVRKTHSDKLLRVATGALLVCRRACSLRTAAYHSNGFWEGGEYSMEAEVRQMRCILKSLELVTEMLKSFSKVAELPLADDDENTGFEHFFAGFLDLACRLLRDKLGLEGALGKCEGDEAPGTSEEESEVDKLRGGLVCSILDITRDGLGLIQQNRTTLIREVKAAGGAAPKAIPSFAPILCIDPGWSAPPSPSSPASSPSDEGPVPESNGDGTSVEPPEWLVHIYNLCSHSRLTIALEARQLVIDLVTAEPAILPDALLSWMSHHKCLLQVVKLLWNSLSIEGQSQYTVCQQLAQVYLRGRKWQRLFKQVLTDDMYMEDGTKIPETHISASGFRRFTIMWRVSEELGLVDPFMLKDPLRVALDTLRGESALQRSRGLSFLKQASGNIPRLMDPFLCVLFSSQQEQSDTRRLEYAINTLHSVVEHGPRTLIRNMIETPTSPDLKNLYESFLPSVSLCGVLQAPPSYYNLLAGVCLRVITNALKEGDEDLPMRCIQFLTNLLEKGTQVADARLEGASSMGALCQNVIEMVLNCITIALQASVALDTAALGLGKVLLVSLQYMHSHQDSLTGSFADISHSPRTPEPPQADGVVEGLSFVGSGDKLANSTAQPHTPVELCEPPSVQWMRLFGVVIPVVLEAMRHTAHMPFQLGQFTQWTEVLLALLPLADGALPAITEAVIGCLCKIITETIEHRITPHSMQVFESALQTLGDLCNFLQGRLPTKDDKVKEVTNSPGLFNLFGLFQPPSDGPAERSSAEVAMQKISLGMDEMLDCIMRLLVEMRKSTPEKDQRKCVDLNGKGLQWTMQKLLKAVYTSNPWQFLNTLVFLYGQQMLEENWMPLLEGPTPQQTELVNILIMTPSVLGADLLIPGLLEVVRDVVTKRSSSKDKRRITDDRTSLYEVCGIHLLIQFLKSAPVERLRGMAFAVPNVVLWLRDTPINHALAPPVRLHFLSIVLTRLAAIANSNDEYANASRNSVIEKKKEIPDIYCKLIEAACRNMSGQVEMIRNGDTVQEVGTFALELVRRDLRMLKDTPFMCSPERAALLFSQVLQQHLSPVIKVGEELNVEKAKKVRWMHLRKINCCVSFLLEVVTMYPMQVAKAVRPTLTEHVFDNHFFLVDPTTLSLWRRLITRLAQGSEATVREMIESALAKIQLPTGVGSVFASADKEAQARAKMLRRLAFLLLCTRTITNPNLLRGILEKLIESTKNYSRQPVVIRQTLLCYRLVLLKVDSHQLASFWPPLIAELISIFGNLKTDRALIVEALKVLDLASVVVPKEFHMYRWIFIGALENAAPSGTGDEEGSPEYTPLLSSLASAAALKSQRASLESEDIRNGSVPGPGREASRLLHDARVDDGNKDEGLCCTPHQLLLAIPERAYDDILHTLTVEEMAAAILSVSNSSDPTKHPIPAAVRNTNHADFDYLTKVMESDFATFNSPSGSHFDPHALLTVSNISANLPRYESLAQSSLKNGRATSLRASTPPVVRSDLPMTIIVPSHSPTGSGSTRPPSLPTSTLNTDREGNASVAL